MQLPVPTKGPFSPDVDALFEHASTAVRVRAEIVDQLQALEKPLDLGAVIAGEREVLGSVVADQVSRYEALSTRLHERLVARLDKGRVEELEGLAEGAVSLTDAIRTFTSIDTWRHHSRPGRPTRGPGCRAGCRADRVPKAAQRDRSPADEHAPR